MADWPVWLWVLIAVVALVIIVALLVGARRKEDIDPDGPFAGETHGGATTQARRGVAPDPADDGAPVADAVAVSPARNLDEPLPDEVETTGTDVIDDVAAAFPVPDVSGTPTDDVDQEDEETLVGPLTIPDEATEAVSEGEDEWSSSDDVVAPAEAAAEVVSEGEDHWSTPEEDAPVDPMTDEDAPSTPPRHTDPAEYGEPLPEADPDDDVPRDEQGRRLDPYGNPVD